MAASTLKWAGVGVRVGRWHGGRHRWGWLLVTIDVVGAGHCDGVDGHRCCKCKEEENEKKLTCSAGFTLICRGWQWRRLQWWSTQVGGGQHVVAVDDMGRATLQQGMSMRKCCNGKELGWVAGDEWVLQQTDYCNIYQWVASGKVLQPTLESGSCCNGWAEGVASGNRWEFDKPLSSIFMYIMYLLIYHSDAPVDHAS